MSAVMMPGQPVADAVFADLQPRIAALRAAGHNPGLGTILVGGDAASAGYIRMKQQRASDLGFGGRHVQLPGDASQADLVAVIRDFNTDDEVDAVLIQHPIPAHLDYEAALAELDPDKDADGAHPTNMGRLALGMKGPLPCTPAGIEALLQFYDIAVAGRDVVIL
ncbi:MAG TPA: tetrahydrofolate dehydrogenase/cyclohydrolase catalytic domain-containing protein, partial [Micropruina sp.]|nr:tetrahydrofolate dehydrogenase/cyclohydrolase catalytic domain-containing protein [Micropruina sp.]